MLVEYEYDATKTLSFLAGGGQKSEGCVFDKLRYSLWIMLKLFVSNILDNVTMICNMLSQ